MADTALPAAGWYADGSTVGVRRWFDGAGWTENTLPDEPAGDLRFSTSAPMPVPSRTALGMSPQDAAEREAAIFRHRLADAMRVRRGAVGTYCCALVLLVVSSGISLALHSPDEMWLAGAVGAGFLVGLAVRNYSRAVHRGAPRLPFPVRVLAGFALVAAIGLFVAVPVEAAQSASHALDGLDGIPGLTGPTVLPDLPGLTDGSG